MPAHTGFDREDWRPAARRMVSEQIERRGVRDPVTLRAMANVPRHCFVPEHQRHQAYADGALPIGAGQTISQPFIVAEMTAVLELRAGDRVLEIGTGSGYQTAVLAEAVGAQGEVFTIERHAELSDRARRLLDDLGYRTVRYRVGDGTLGWPEAAPFDRIIVTAAGPFLPRDLRDQLDRAGGVMVIPMGSRHQQELFRFAWRGGDWVEESLGHVTFVPLIGEQGWEE
jgi:protein-L-isoaspartate(D-aspartate) O-methyltransferase